jgi:hypothetical protein
MTALLPPGFESLSPFVDRWAKRTTEERLAARSTASMREIELFYDAMLSRASDAIEYLERLSLHQMPEDAARLFSLLLSLCQASMAVEVHRAPRAPNSPFPHGISVVLGASPLG